MRGGRFQTTRQGPVNPPLTRLGLSPLATADPDEARRFVERAQFVKLMKPDELKAAFYLRAQGATVKAENARFEVTIARQVIHATAADLAELAKFHGMKPARVFPIRFLPRFFPQLVNGEKIETRRTNLRWAEKAQAGDMLRILSSAKDVPAPLRVIGVKTEPLLAIDEDGARREGFPSVEAFLTLWAELHRKDETHKPEQNPTVCVLGFLENEAAIVEVLS